MMKTLLFAVLALAVLSLMFEAVTANNNWEQGTLGEGDSEFFSLCCVDCVVLVLSVEHSLKHSSRVYGFSWGLFSAARVWKSCLTA